LSARRSERRTTIVVVALAACVAAAIGVALLLLKIDSPTAKERFVAGAVRVDARTASADAELVPETESTPLKTPHAPVAATPFREERAPGRRIRCVDAASRPAAGAFVETKSGRFPADGGGLVVLPVATEGYVAATAPGFACEALRVPPPTDFDDDASVVVLTKGGVVKGRVTDVGGAPRAGVVVTVRDGRTTEEPFAAVGPPPPPGAQDVRISWDGSRSVRRAVSRDDGAFELNGFGEGPYTLDAAAPPGATAVLASKAPRGDPSYGALPIDARIEGVTTAEIQIVEVWEAALELVDACPHRAPCAQPASLSYAMPKGFKMLFARPPGEASAESAGAVASAKRQPQRFRYARVADDYKAHLKVNVRGVCCGVRTASVELRPEVVGEAPRPIRIEANADCPGHGVLTVEADETPSITRDKFGGPIPSPSKPGRWVFELSAGDYVVQRGREARRTAGEPPRVVRVRLEVGGSETVSLR
jgi:hypothetical protein